MRHADTRVHPPLSAFRSPLSPSPSPSCYDFTGCLSVSPSSVCCWLIVAPRQIREGNGVADGIRCDAKGNLWASTGEGINVFAPDGDMIAKILTPVRVPPDPPDPPALILIEREMTGSERAPFCPLSRRCLAAHSR